MTISSTLAEAVVAAVIQARDIIAELIRQESPFEDGLLPPSAGGTGVDNGTHTLTLGASVTISSTPPGIPVEIAEGGTGATTAATARSSLGTNDAANITAGTLAAARLGASPTASKFLKGDNSWAAIVSGDLPAHAHAAADITSGTMATARLGSGTASASTLLWGDSTWAALVAGDIPDLDASTITTGTFADARIPSLAASKITSGTMAAARLGSGTPSASTVLFGDSTWAALAAGDIPNLDTAKITTGTFADARIPSLAASKITSGTMATARLGSGTAASNNVLHGDSTWSQVVLTSEVTGILPGANGGTGVNNSGRTLTLQSNGTLDMQSNRLWVGTDWDLGAVFTSSPGAAIAGYIACTVGGVTRKIAITT